MSDTVSTLAAQLRAQSLSGLLPGVDWDQGGIDRAVELATMLANAGVTDLSQMSLEGSHTKREAGYKDPFQGGADADWDPGGYDGQYRLKFGDDLYLGNLGSSSGKNDGTWVTDYDNVLDSEFGGGYGQKYQEWTPEEYLHTGGKGWDPENGFFGEIAWSPEGKGHVGYKVVVGPDGTPQILPEWGSSSDMDTVRDMFKIAAIAVTMGYGLPALTGAGVTSAGGLTASQLAAADIALGGVGGSSGAGALSSALAGGIYSPLVAGAGEVIGGGAGAETTLGGITSASSSPTSLLGGITKEVSGGIAKLLPTAVANQPILGTTVSNLLGRAVVSGTMSELLGGDFKTGFLTSGLGTLGTGALTALDVPKALAPYITTAATVAARGGTFEDFVRSAGINYLTSTPQQREALNKIFTTTASNITDAVSTFGDASGTGTAVGGTAEDIFGDFEWGDVDPTQDDMYTPDSRSGTLRLEVNGATDPETDFPWGNEDPTQDDMYTPDYRSGSLRLEVDGATEPEPFQAGDESMWYPPEPETDFPWGNEDPTQDDMYTPDYRSGPLRLEVDGATEPEPFQAGDESMWYPPTADPVGDESMWYPPTADPVGDESMWYPPETETDFPWGDTDPTQDDMYIPDPEGPGSTTGSPTDTSPDGQPNDREDPDWVNTPGTGGTGGTGGGGGRGNTPTPTPENPNWMLGLAALMAASMMQNKSPTTQTKRYQMPTVGAPNLPQSYTVGWQAPDYMRVPNGGYRNN